MSCELFVGNLNPDVRASDLENCFGKYGKIVRCNLKKSYGFIQLADKEDAERAIRKENERRLLGSVMTVEWAKGSVGDKSKGGSRRVIVGSPPADGFRKPRVMPGRLNERSGNRPPSGVSRPPRRFRSPIGKGFIQRTNGFSPHKDKFAGSKPPRGRPLRVGRDNFAKPRFDSGPSRGTDSFAPRDRFQSNDRFNDKGSNRGPPEGNVRGPPPRDNGLSDRHRRGGFGDRRSSFSERRNLGSSRRF